MSKSRSVLTVDIDVELQKLQSKLQTAESSLTKFGSNSTIDGLRQKFTELQERLTKIGKLNGKELDQGGFEKLGTQVSEIDTELQALITSFKKIKSSSKDSKEGFFPTETAEKIKSAETAMEAYKEAVKQAGDAAKQLEDAKKELDAIDKKIEQNQKDQVTVQGKIAKATEQEAAIKTKLAKIQVKKSDPKEAANIDQLVKAEKEYQDQLSANQSLIATHKTHLQELKQAQNGLANEYLQTGTRVEQLENQLKDQDSVSTQLQNAYAALLAEARKLDSSFNDLDEEFSDGSEDQLLAGLKNLKKQGFDQLDRSLDETVQSLKDCSEEQDRLERNVAATTQEVKQQDQVMDSVGSLQSRISQYVGMEGIINALSRALRDAFETVKELDASMTEMAVVTDFEVGDYWEQLPQYTKRASELGLAINDVYQADMLYYQQGLKTNQVVAVSTETMKMAKIAGLDTADATDRMTAALRGFNMEIDEASAKRISDVYSELAAITASDVDEISTAMTKTASIASSAGMEFETTAAFLSQIIETTREAAETAGTALKTVIARFQELTKDPAEIGEVDGEVVDANKIETALRSVGVALRDSSGQFRELDDVFLELASKWDSLDKNTQRYIATIAAGSRQQSRFIAMMSDYGRTQELVAAANDSSGASNEQFEKTLDSLSTKLNKLKDAWDTFTMGLLDNQLIKGAITILTGLLNVINKIFEVVDKVPLLGVVTRVGLIVGGLVLLDKVLKNFFVSLTHGNGVLASAGAALKGYSLNQNGVKVATIKLTAADKAYMATLTEEEQQLYMTLLAQEAETGATQLSTRAKIKNTLVTIKDNVVKAASVAWNTLKAAGLMIIIPLTRKETKEKAKSALASALEAAGIHGTTIALAAKIALVILAIAVCALLVLGVLKLCGAFDSAEKKLEDANKALESAEEAAKKVTDEYNNMATALDELDAKYDTLEKLQRGTEEWSKAVQEANDQVLDLIDTYPELASLVENKGGVLSIDTDSEQVQAVMQAKENQMIAAKGAELGAKMHVTELNAQATYEQNQKAMDDFSNRADDLAGVGAGVVMGAGTGILAGAVAGAAAGTALGTAIPIVGNIVGLVVGGLVGIAGGIISGLAVKEATLIHDEIAKENIDQLSKAYASGEAGTTRESMIDYIVTNGLAEAGTAAEDMADAFFENKEELLDYGRTLNETEAQMKAYYTAIATNAQQMLDLGAYTEKQIDQMTEVVDEDITKSQIEAEKEALSNMDKDELEKAKNDFVRDTYGAGSRIDGNTIIDAQGNEYAFESEEALLQQIAASKATKKAAEAMEKVPSMINNALNIFKDNGTYKSTEDQAQAEAIEKALSGKALTQEETQNYQKALGSASYLDKEGNPIANSIDELQKKYESDAQLQSTYGTFENYKKSLDEDLSGVRDMWNKLSVAEKEAIYGGTDETAYEKFENEFQKTNKEFNEQWSKTEENMKEMGMELSDISYNIASDAAQAWTEGLLEITPNRNDTKELNTALNELLKGLTPDEAAEVMREVNSLDKMDKNAWQDLPYIVEQLGINIPTSKFESFIETAIEVSGAIDKIDFTKLSNGINETYQLLDKVKEGGRKYSDEEYQKFIAANKTLEKNFTKVGDEFLYIGGSIHDLETALQENTTAVLGEGNRQLASITEMAKVISSLTEYENGGFADPNSMTTEDQLRKYLMAAREGVVGKGRNLADFGITGLDNATIFSTASFNQLQTWATELARRGANLKLYEEDYAKELREANIQRYTHNTSLYNAQLAAGDSEFADEHAEALILQAIRSGGVSEAMIEAYKQATTAEVKDYDEILRLGQVISDSVDEIVKEDEGRDAYIDLINQVKDAIVELRQREIDKLSDVNDSINNANDLLISKIQEQIDADRQARDNAEAEKELADMRSRLAYLGADTSGVNTLAAADLTKEIAEAEQDLQDARIDQAIANLQDANEKAAEQRERQIDLLTSQLAMDQELGRITAHAEQVVQKSLTEVNNGTATAATKIGEMIALASNWDSMSYDEQTQLRDQLQKTGVAGANYLRVKDNPNTTGTQGPGGVIDEKGINRDNALQAMGTAIVKARQSGNPFTKEGLEQGTEYSKNKQAFLDNEGSQEEYDTWYWSQISAINDSINQHQVSLTVDSIGRTRDGGSWRYYDFKESDLGISKNWLNKIVMVPVGDTVKIHGYPALASDHIGQFMYDKGVLYHSYDGEWWKTQGAATGTKRQMREAGALLEGLKAKYPHLNSYKTGGLADFTGPAWLDGTRSKPEIVLNQRDSANFLVLKDVLSEILEGTSGIAKSKQEHSGDNYYDINISVDNLSDDYDVEQLADKIRRMIYDDATYRNVNTINLIR